MANLEEQVSAILERNRRVEADKAWEVSWCRRISVAVLTYLTALLFLWLIENNQLWWNAIVPAGAYLLSTSSLPWLKQRWIRKRYR